MRYDGCMDLRVQGRYSSEYWCLGYKVGLCGFLLEWFPGRPLRGQDAGLDGPMVLSSSRGLLGFSLLGCKAIILCIVIGEQVPQT